MSHYLILAQSEVTALALGGWLELLNEPELQPTDPKCIIWDREYYSGGEGAVLAYEYLASAIECVSGGNEGKIPLNEIVVLVDTVRPKALSAIAEGITWDNLIAMLILTFPEIHWVFGVILGSLEDLNEQEEHKAKFLVAEHSLPSLLSCPRRDAIFDSLELRQWVKDCTVKFDKGNNLNLPNRMHKAAAIEDEKSFAYFHGYTSFRYGYRTDVVTSWTLMSKLFNDGQNDKGHGFELLLEDMSLNFPDKPLNKNILDFDIDNDKKQGRAYHFLRLHSACKIHENSKFRILITTGQDMPCHDTLKKNLIYLKEHKKEGCGRKVLKPSGGMMDLWQKAGLFRFLREKLNRRGNAKGFFWPPRLLTPDAFAEGIGHGAPGKLMLIAETLLNRALETLPKANTVQDFIQGAVLATEAAELLSGMTPTMTLQALVLKHEFEARAECAFVGVGYHFDVKTRADEIENEVNAIAVRFAKNKRRESELHSLITIMNRLAQVFREAGRFEEEHECMVRMRRWHRHLVGLKVTNPFRLLTNGILWYAEFLLASFPLFMLVILLWLGASCMAWWFIDGSWKAAISGVWSAFFSGTAAPDKSSWSLIGITCIIVASGFFHLGVLVAYIYSLISRR
ncbi:hypothetical protein [Methylomonas fluvii]|nr:hypothetical protein [Methylomonas fluvii]